jgi:anti-sigma factor RsiW
MRECHDADVRDLLPELVRGTLGPTERARVAAHVAGCASCRAEVALLGDVRALHPLPPVNAARIVAALPRSPRAPAADPAGVVSLDAHRRLRARAGWPWRRMVGVAAVLTGVASVALLGGRGGRGGRAAGAGGPSAPATTDSPAARSTATAAGTPTLAGPSVAPTRGPGDVARAGSDVRPPATTARPTDALGALGALGGVASEITDDELEALIAGLETLSGIPDVEADVSGADGGAE